MTGLVTATHAGRRKAAVALVALGPERAATILRSLGDYQVGLLAEAIANLGPVSPDEVRETMTELAKGMGEPNMLPAPGKKFAKDLLVRALGAERGAAAGQQLDVPKPFGWLAEADPDAAANGLSTEPAGAVALALAHIDPKIAARILIKLPIDDQAKVAARIAALGAVHPETVRQVEIGLKARVSDILHTDVKKVDGPEVLAGLLAKAGRDTSRELLQAIAAVSPELAELTRNALFTFDDVCSLESRSMQVLLRSVDTKQLSVALSSSPEAIKAKVLGNLSERARESLMEEMELLRGLRGPEIAEARAAIVAVARQLEEEGSLVLTRADDV